MARPYSSKAAGGFDLPSLSDDEDGSSTTASTRDPESGYTVLGYIDGAVASTSTLDWKTSRVGGLPTFPPLTTSPSATSAHCGVCARPMPLLTQIYCPLDDSLFERVVYTFGCPAKACRGKDGGVRAWRAGVRWVDEADVEKPVVEGSTKEKLRLGDFVFGAAATVPGPVGGAANFNPFAPNPAAPSGPAANPFAPAAAPPFNPFAPAHVVNSSAPSAAPNPFSTTPALPPAALPARRSNLDLLTSSFASSSLASEPQPEHGSEPTPFTGAPDPAWLAHPTFPPQYLTTAYEPTPPPAAPLARLPIQTLATATLDPVEDTHREGKGSGGRVKKGAAAKPGTRTAGADGWGGEGYEVQCVRGVDDVFLRFQERVAREGLQCVRYAHSSTPLPFSSISPAYARLFPSTPAAPLGAYDPARIPRCRHCGSESTFEYQLMPTLVTSLARIGLRDSPKDDVKGKERSVLEADGVEFATVMVFACLRECVDEDGTGDEAWREEPVSLELEIN